MIERPWGLTGFGKKEGSLGLTCRFLAWVIEGKVQLPYNRDMLGNGVCLVMVSEMKLVGRSLDI